MKFPAFAYAAPATVEQAVDVLAEDEDARPLAGGQTLLPILALRMASPSCLVDLGGIESLRQITVGASGVTVGAMVTHAANASAPAHREHVPLLHQAVRHVAHEAVRNRGTIGGSIAYADAAAEMPLVAVALDATMHLARRGGERAVPAGEFFHGHYSTAIDEGELLTAIEFPKTEFTWAFDEVSRRPGDFALVMTAVGVQTDGDRVTSARIALGSVADRPIRASAAEAALEGQALTAAVIDEAARLATADLRSHADIHASAEYRRDVAANLVRRSLRSLVPAAAA